jgi:hypothetical protein
MAAIITRAQVAPDPNGLVLVVSQDQVGGFWIRIEDYYGAHDYQVSKAFLLQFSANIVTVANS